MSPACTVSALRRAARDVLSEAGVDSPDLDARLLVASVLGCDPAALVARGDDPVGEDVAGRVQALVERRRAGEPVARILGRKEFWSLDFALAPETLVPRPDTETVVEAALAAFPDGAAPLRVLDLGIGSGAILAAILSERPRAFGVGVDCAAGAARAARDNLERAGLAGRAAVIVGDWAEALRGGFDLVVSNPPYIPASEIASLDAEVRRHDPMLALDGGADGLDAYRAIARALPRLLVPGGVVVLELGIGQEADVSALLTAAGLCCDGPARRDLGGIPRALVAHAP